jgi:DNA-binding NarL/FixJ family response regulator
MPAERWYTKREIARTLRVSVSTIERHVRPTMRVGGQNRYTMGDVQRQLGATPQPKGDVVELRPREAA